ncbi:uncharacterized protein LOC123530895 [Mercenaria mercenaria]|uniref:uncharacterized protein LOC123530895 n=1 Tax=Mercenaria mercenaria TaxID=6596 RepID=UPI00234F8FDC|nr:uncharacterized protein LOC123530895 [Mercenaria mercenaria]
MDMVILLYACFHLCAVVYGLTNTFVYELYSENEINGNAISSYDTNSVQACVTLCDMSGCLSVNFHKDDGKCVLTDYYPTDNTKSGEPKLGWKIYFRRQFDIKLLEGAVAWQSSTLVWGGKPESADRAIDGYSDAASTADTCSHTNSGDINYWAVEFGTPGPVKEVEIYFRNFCCYYHRNTNFTITVSNSRVDVLNDNGKLCRTYFGPAVDKEPFHLTIPCINTIYGKFLKIKHDVADVLILCEVVVKTP